MSTKTDAPDLPAPVLGKSDAEKAADAEMAAVVQKLMDNGSRAGLAVLAGVMRDLMIAHGWLGKKQLDAMVQGRLADIPMFKALEQTHGKAATKIAWEAAMLTALGKSRLELAEND